MAEQIKVREEIDGRIDVIFNISKISVTCWNIIIRFLII